MKKVSLYIMTVFYLFAGVNHFINPQFYLKIMPPWMPYHKELVFISGVFEILFALLLIFQSTRRVGAWCIILLLIAIFPANIQMLLNYIHENNTLLWVAILRLPLQVLLILWAYSFTKRITPLLGVSRIKDEDSSLNAE
jgi:uncharacterized membrane protein